MTFTRKTGTVAAATVLGAVLVAPSAYASNLVAVGVSEASDWNWNLTVSVDVGTKVSSSGKPCVANISAAQEDFYDDLTYACSGTLTAGGGTDYLHVSAKGSKQDLDGNSIPISCSFLVHDPVIGFVNVYSTTPDCQSSGIDVSSYKDFDMFHGQNYTVIMNLVGAPQRSHLLQKAQEVRAATLQREDCIRGTDGPDNIVGTDGPDCIITGSGDDVVDGRGGDDIIITGSGDDTVNGGDGDDIIFTGRGDDIVDPGPGDDIVHTATGEDSIVSRDNGDTVLDSQNAPALAASQSADPDPFPAGLETLNSMR